MFLQLLTIHERSMDFIYQLPFLIRQTVWISRIYGREVCIAQWIFFSFIYKDTSLKINLIQ